MKVIYFGPFMVGTASAHDDSDAASLIQKTTNEHWSISADGSALSLDDNVGLNNSWNNDLVLTHYWDCNGQGCDATTLQPWEPNNYVSSPGYGPVDPNCHGGAVYGEKMWLTGAANDALANAMGGNDLCCGADNDSGGCGKCLLIKNPESANPDWTAVIMKKNRCPPWTNGCGAGDKHFDVAVPGYDNLQYSTANICGNSKTGFANKQQSAVLGSWYNSHSNTAQAAGLCDQLPAAFQDGCKLFSEWGWTTGNPHSAQYQFVDCPPKFKEHIQNQFSASGPTPDTSCSGVTPTPTDPPVTPAPTDPPATPAPTDPPATPAPTDPPATPAPTDPPATPAPTDPPVTPAPTDPPATPAPTDPPATPAPTDPPVTPAPTDPPVTPAPTDTPAPVTPAPPPPVIDATGCSDNQNCVNELTNNPDNFCPRCGSDAQFRVWCEGCCGDCGLDPAPTPPPAPASPINPDACSDNQNCVNELNNNGPDGFCNRCASDPQFETWCGGCCDSC